MTKSRVFKSHMPSMRVPFRDSDEAIFRNGRLITSDEKLIKNLEQVAKEDKALGIYIDPKEPEIEGYAPGTDHELRQQQLKEFMERQTKQIDAGSTENKAAMTVASTASSPTTGGKSVPAPHFTKADTAALLASKLKPAEPTK